MAQISIPQPRLTTPPTPPPGSEILVSWLTQTITELSRWFSLASFQLLDSRAILGVGAQQLSNGFTLVSNQPIVEMFTTGGPVISDAANAISDGVIGQLLILENKGPDTVTIKNAAATLLQGGVADYTMNVGDTLVLKWNGTLWIEITRSVN